MAIKNLTELDFDGIKNNLKLYLQAQEQFQDYDFEASGLSVLTDLLAYNTQYNALLAHMTSNEAFIDSAVKRNSIASIAKTMGYTARSARAASATVSLTITPDTAYTNGALTLSRDLIFSTNLNGKTLNFFPIKDYTATLENRNGTSNFYFEDIVIVEGTRVLNSTIIEDGSTSGPVVMVNDNVDTTTIRCRVQTSTKNTTTETFNVSDNILDVKTTSAIFYVEEGVGGQYQVVFGDGVLGKKLDIGNVVRVDYIATNTTLGNGAKTFRYPTNITGANETTVMTVGTASAGGTAQESIDSIRYNAPRFNATKNRAVTANDYKSLILQNNPNVKSVAVWGGEDNVPPVYGKVFVSLQPIAGLVITQDDKDGIIRDYIEPRSPIAITTEFVDPEYSYIGIAANITYDAKKTTLTAGQLQANTKTTLEGYFDTELNILDRNFYYSKLASQIVSSSVAIVAVNLEIRIQKRLTPAINVPTNYEYQFNNKINPLSITSNFFTAKINNATHIVYVSDVPGEGVTAPLYSGVGRLVLKTVANNTVVNAAAGTVNYDTGTINLASLDIVSLSGTGNVALNINVQPHESAKDIRTEILTRTTVVSTSAVSPTPSKNIILVLDTSVADIPNNILSGVTVTASPKVVDY
tara:strand:- start:43352 stop:45265 length:1914 start_codon:yes stop_codon:yes gene_type:complete